MDGRRIYNSMAYQKVLGYSPEELKASSSLAEIHPEDRPRVQAAAEQARLTGVRGETYAYWYLRRHGYILVARNYTLPGMKGEIDMVGYDGPMLAFVEVKTAPG